MKFLKTIVGDILMIPVAFEISYKLIKDIDIKNDDNLSKYAKWAVNLVDELQA
jgi:uncharacterized protein YqhQ